MEAYDGDIYHGWAEYIVYGGLPLTVTMKTEEQKINYLTNLFTETYLKDIIERHRIEKTQELDGEYSGFCHWFINKSSKN